MPALEIDQALTNLARAAGGDQYVVWRERQQDRDQDVLVVKRRDRPGHERLTLTARELLVAAHPLDLYAERVEQAVRTLEGRGA